MLGFAGVDLLDAEYGRGDINWQCGAGQRRWRCGAEELREELAERAALGVVLVLVRATGLGQELLADGHGDGRVIADREAVPGMMQLGEEDVASHQHKQRQLAGQSPWRDACGIV